MDDYQGLLASEAGETQRAALPRRFSKAKVGTLAVLGLFGCGLFRWENASSFDTRDEIDSQDMMVELDVTPIPMDSENEHTEEESQLSDISEADYNLVFGAQGPSADHIRRNASAALLYQLHGQVDVDTDTNAHAIYQGQLGDCYFDAALAAIAHTHPDLIKKMFKKIDVNRGVFETEWFVAGRKEIVTVNAEVPTNPNRGLPFFLWTSSELALWPAILEKAYAKIIGSYKSIEAGFPLEVFQYMLGVEVGFLFSQTHWQSVISLEPYGEPSNENIVWEKIMAGVKNKYPIGIGTARGGYSCIHGGHAYTLYGASNNYKGYGKAVRIRNPWGINSYCGAIKGQTKTVGDVWITWQEWKMNFVVLNIATVRPGYSVVNIGNVKIDGCQGQTRCAPAGQCTSFTMSQRGPWSVQLNWPSTRMTKAAHCRGIQVAGFVRVSQGGVSKIGRALGTPLLNTIRVDGSGSGTWRVCTRIAGSFGPEPSFSLTAQLPSSGAKWSEVLEYGEHDDGQLPPDMLELPETPSMLEMPASSMLPEVYTPIAAKNIDLRTCASYYRRFSQDLGGNVLPDDPYFPHTEASIAEPGVDCGDAAHGIYKPCSSFNHWTSMITTANTMNDDRKCFSHTPSGGQCLVYNYHCNHAAEFFCNIKGCMINDARKIPSRYGFRLQAACCGCNNPNKFR